MFNALEPWHLLIIVGVLVVLFGAKRLPGSARSIGRSMRIFRSEMAAGRHDDEATRDSTDSPGVTTSADAASVAPAALPVTAHAAASTQTAQQHADTAPVSRV